MSQSELPQGERVRKRHLADLVDKDEDEEPVRGKGSQSQLKVSFR